MGDCRQLSMASPECFHVLGRTNGERMPLTLFWTASGFEVNYNGTELWCDFVTDYTSFEQWIAVEVNGAVIVRQMLPKGESHICLCRNMQTKKENTIRVFKEVQAMPGDEKALLQVVGLFGDGELLPVKEKTYRLEFVGDSITSGEGSYGAQGEPDWIAQWFSTTNTYPYLTAQSLNAEYRVVSQSGYGLLTAWDNNRDNNIPAYYEQVCGVLAGERNLELGAKKPYDFSKWQPDAVIINLGTNDAGAFDQPAWTDPRTGKVFKMERDAQGKPLDSCLLAVTDAACEFLFTVRKNNPNAQILWCLGIMGSLTSEAVTAGINKYCEASGDKKAAFLPLAEMTKEQVGARFHPGLLGHRAAADEVTKKLSELLNKE